MTTGVLKGAHRSERLPTGLHAIEPVVDVAMIKPVVDGVSLHDIDLIARPGIRIWYGAHRIEPKGGPQTRSAKVATRHGRSGRIGREPDFSLPVAVLARKPSPILVHRGEQPRVSPARIIPAQNIEIAILGHLTIPERVCSTTTIQIHRADISREWPAIDVVEDKRGKISAVGSMRQVTWLAWLRGKRAAGGDL
jgi:hypothetical protein